MSTLPDVDAPRPAVRLRGLRKRFGTGEQAVDAVAGVDLDVRDGEFLTIAHIGFAGAPPALLARARIPIN